MQVDTSQLKNQTTQHSGVKLTAEESDREGVYCNTLDRTVFSGQTQIQLNIRTMTFILVTSCFVYFLWYIQLSQLLPTYPSVCVTTVSETTAMCWEICLVYLNAVLYLIYAAAVKSTCLGQIKTYSVPVLWITAHIEKFVSGFKVGQQA